VQSLSVFGRGCPIQKLLDVRVHLEHQTPCIELPFTARNFCEKHVQYPRRRKRRQQVAQGLQNIAPHIPGVRTQKN